MTSPARRSIHPECSPSSAPGPLLPAWLDRHLQALDACDRPIQSMALADEVVAWASPAGRVMAHSSDAELTRQAQELARLGLQEAEAIPPPTPSALLAALQALRAELRLQPRSSPSPH